jgi:hypothetical protein
MATRRTWIWIVAGVGGAGVLALVAVAAAGVYFVTQRVQANPATSADAKLAFDGVLEAFGDARPLYELDQTGDPRATRPLRDLPSAEQPPGDLNMLAWDPEHERLVRVALPFWMLRVGQQKLSFSHDHPGFDLDRLNLDVAELGRIAPALVFDYRDEHGVRVLLWTQ